MSSDKQYRPTNPAELFHAVKTASDIHKQTFWEICAASAEGQADPGAAMMKIALDVWAEEFVHNRTPRASRDVREALAASFGSSYEAGKNALKLASAGRLTLGEAHVVRAHIARSAIEDLINITKTADGMQGYDPSQMGGDPSQMGGDPSQMGGDPSQMGGDPSQMEGDPNAEPESIGGEGDAQAGMVEDLDRAQNTIKNLIFLANQVQRPALAAQIEQNADMLTAHFAKGNAYLPPEFQHHFSASEHAAEFLKKYKERFGALGAKSSAK